MSTGSLFSAVTHSSSATAELPVRMLFKIQPHEVVPTNASKSWGALTIASLGAFYLRSRKDKEQSKCTRTRH